jgi:2-polyprenyl-6-methoxyphenol hydroxylase-like FAD-dependent oxidoreductase
MTGAQHVPVLVAGAGPTGLVLAAELSRHGINSVLGELVPDGAAAPPWRRRNFVPTVRPGHLGDVAV